MKIIRINNTAVVVFDNGNSYQRELTEEEFQTLYNCKKEQEALSILSPEYVDVLKKREDVNNIILDVESSNILTKKGDSIYWEDISELSMPSELVKAVIEAESNDDEDKLEAYKNFWTLMSLNPDSRCRQNLFWFLNRYGMTISKYGLFVGYRNVDTYQKANSEAKYTQAQVDFEYGPNKDFRVFKSLEGYSKGNLAELYQYFKERNFDLDLINPNTETIYTDNYTHTFRIKIGELVTMPREETDTIQENSCSRGLHIGGETWLQKHYFGDTGLICLVNPKDVVAVPPIDDYGKLRTCAYLPIGTVKYDNQGKVIPYKFEDGFNSEYVKEVLYSGNKATEKYATYTLEIPEIPELNRTKITQNIIDIANSAIKDRVWH